MVFTIVVIGVTVITLKPPCLVTKNMERTIESCCEIGKYFEDNLVDQLSHLFSDYFFQGYFLRKEVYGILLLKI